MKAEVCVQLLKFCFQVLNCVLLVLGVSVLSCSLWILFGSGNLLNLLPSDEVRVVGLGLLLIGGLVLLVSAIGCMGAHGEKVLLLLAYLALLVVLVLGQLFVALLLVINRDAIGRSLDETVDHLISRYGPDGAVLRLLDGVQKQGQCCGRTGPSDWLTNTFIQNASTPDVLPCSCFNSSHSASPWCSSAGSLPRPLIGQGAGLYQQGCGSAIGDWLRQNVLTVAGMAVGLILIQALQAVTTAQLWRAVGRKAASTGGAGPPGPEEGRSDRGCTAGPASTSPWQQGT